MVGLPGGAGSSATLKMSYNNRVQTRAKIRSCRMSLAALLLCLAASPVSTAAATDPQGSNFDLSGTIAKQSAGKLTVDTGQGILFRVSWSDETSIVRADGSAGSAKDLKVGLKVHVLGDLQETGEVKAQRIEIQGEQSKGSAQPQT